MPSNCPHCGSDFRGAPIPHDQQHLYGDTHFSRIIGIENPDIYDGVYKYRCPDCGKSFPREGLEHLFDEE